MMVVSCSTVGRERLGNHLNDPLRMGSDIYHIDESIKGGEKQNALFQSGKQLSGILNMSGAIGLGGGDGIGNGDDGICGNGDDSGVSGDGGGVVKARCSRPLPRRN
ncbi:hypothetical protein Tco_1045587 [Tanacetum coccineum]|uniref:Uncharacterized protein n=1 Tax=Tanacetum coccineum TaxID=301880 RepID=A0ABQ5GVF3_9ASTR